MKTKTILVLAFLISISAFSSPATAAISDHVFNIDMWYEFEHLNPLDLNDVEYEFWFEVETDATIVLVEFDTPAGMTYQIPDLTDYWDDVNQVWTDHEYDADLGTWTWDFSKTSDNPTVFNNFGDGTYTVTFHYAGGGIHQTQIVFLNPNTSQPMAKPMQVPIITYPPYRTSINSPVTMSWLPCTDPNTNGLWLAFENESADLEVEADASLGQTTWGPHPLPNGYWRQEVFFDNRYQISPDGIDTWIGKSRFTTSNFAVGIPWAAYEVWGGNTDYTTYPQWWNYYFSIDQYDYVKLGQSATGETITVNGTYNYYVIAPLEPVLIDAIRGSTGQFYHGGWATAGIEDWDNVSGRPDKTYGHLGHLGWGGSFIGFLRIDNPGTWTSITVIGDDLQQRPRPPKRIDATDGLFTDQVRIRCSTVPEATQYRLFRSDAIDTAKVPLGKWKASPRFIDRSVVPGLTYYYWIKTKNAAGVSRFSNHDTGWASN